MIQEIGNLQLNNAFIYTQPQNGDYIVAYKNNMILAYEEGEVFYLPRFNSSTMNKEKFYYIFSIGTDKYYLYNDFNNDFDMNKLCGYDYYPVNIYRTAKPKATAFALITGYHLYNWYRTNVKCGRCGTELIHDKKERMLRCPKCSNLIYPRINPAVIVSVRNNDKLLLTKYANAAYKNYALIAGFAEIGETIEQTVRREVKEETGLNVKNIKYYKSQPWALSGSLLMGFECELDGSSEVTLQEEELASAEWFTADEIDVVDNGISLTNEMIIKFKREFLL